MSVTEPSDAVNAGMAKQTEGRRTPSVSSVVGWSAAEGCGEFCYSHLGCNLTMDDRGSRLLRNVGDNIRSHKPAANSERVLDEISAPCQEKEWEVAVYLPAFHIVALD